MAVMGYLRVHRVGIIGWKMSTSFLGRRLWARMRTSSLLISKAWQFVARFGFEWKDDWAEVEWRIQALFAGCRRASKFFSRDVLARWYYRLAANKQAMAFFNPTTLWIMLRYFLDVRYKHFQRILQNIYREFWNKWLESPEVFYYRLPRQ